MNPERNEPMTIGELRAEIDRIDSELIRLYRERMEMVRQIGLYKQEHHLLQLQNKLILFRLIRFLLIDPS